MILRKLKSKSSIKTIIFSLVIGYAIVSYFLKSFIQVEFPYQIEFRETAIVSVVNLIKEGKNPFQYENLPQYTYVYGIGNPFIINFLTTIANSNILITARTLSFISIILSVLFIFLVINKLYQNKNKLIAAALTISIIPILETLAGVGAFPTSLAVLILVASVTIPYLFDFKNESIFISIVISLVGFFIKPYCLLGSIYLISYILLFRSLRFGFVIGIVSVFVLFSSIAICQYLNPAFLALSYYSFSCANISSFDHMRNQTKELFNNFLIIKWYLVVFILIVFFYKKPSIKIYI